MTQDGVPYKNEDFTEVVENNYDVVVERILKEEPISPLSIIQ